MPPDTPASMNEMPLGARSRACCCASFQYVLPPSTIASPRSSRPPNSSIVLFVGAPAGNITHTCRGGASALTNSASDEQPFAPIFADAATAAGLRSNAAHVWPPSSKRSTILAPILPNPTMPSCMSLPFRRCRHRKMRGGARDRARERRKPGIDVHAEVHPHHATPVRQQRLIIAERLRVLERAEVERLIGDPARHRVAADHLDEDARVGAALVQLPGGVQESGRSPASSPPWSRPAR